ncbi:hypothetical protein CCACVL1_23740 [Corchorus capsularis]|uniref:RNase H type-1 domain-containing protein n=1 Tax=Corchorus capsularis TaxID=210143 RepID=A0A1R3GSU4_COCAP|nr:hypothetical protein CCACVL1_23740 [Corchorus capsularis]
MMLASLSKGINIYSKFATSSSADPSFQDEVKEIKVWYADFGRVDLNSIDSLEKEIHELELSLQQNAPDDNTYEVLFQKKDKLWKLYRSVERSWQQKSRIRWLMEGDKNTRYFKLVAACRAKRNQILKIDVNGKSIDQPQQIKDSIADYFESFYNLKTAVKVLDLDIPFMVLSEASVLWLEKEFTEDEIFAAVKDCEGRARVNSIGVWKPVIDRCKKKLDTWKAKHLSSAERLVMIKSVLSSFLVYFMSLFPLPATVRNELDKLIKRFFWSGSNNKRKLHFVDWNSITNLKCFGGLEITDLGIQNRALLNKWIWRFGNEENSLWRNVVAAKNGLQVDKIIPSTGNRMASSLWKIIVKPLFGNDALSVHTKPGLFISIKDGSIVDFWRDKWVDDLVLSEAFPRIFALASNKNGKAADFGYFDGNTWKWADDIWKLVWAGFAPPKTRIFVWQVLKKRIAVKFELCKRGLISLDSALCAFCGNKLETIEHFLFWCQCSWNIWTACCKLWGIDWVIPKDPIIFFLSWHYALANNRKNKLWRMLLFVVVRFPQEVTVVCKRPVRSGSVVWEAPKPSFLKFNVDGAAKGKPGPAGIGGVLRDENGKIWMDFSKSMGIMDSNEAELCAIREAILLFSTSKWANSHALIIESDSRNVVSWVGNPDSVPWKLRRWVLHISSLIKGLTGFSISHIFREGNVEADTLAKEGVDRTDPCFNLYN